MSVRQGKRRAATSRLLPMVPLGGAIIAMLLVVANCSDRPPARRWRVTPHKAAGVPVVVLGAATARCRDLCHSTLPEIASAASNTNNAMINRLRRGAVALARLIAIDCPIDCACDG